MSIDQHVENRAWAFQALDDIQQFVEDPDFEGDVEEERVLIERKRKELKEGKYRVVFLGAFNVGKSTLINAFLGDDYLPTILEECTTKITHVTQGEAMRAVINLTTVPEEQEVQTLRDLLAAYGIRCSVEQNSEREVCIQFEDGGARGMVQCLRALTTMSADEDYPQLRGLRGKYEELFIYVPNERLEEDIALVDSPGVHSISETNRKVAHDIIPDSHLVVCMLDSQSAGNEQSREFIERIIKHRHRKVFFLLNKADQLNGDEIDPTGHRGPAKDLLRSLEGIVDGPELFFVSSLYALVAAKLGNGRLKLEDLDNDNKVKIPFAVMRQLLDAESPEQGAANHLMERSLFPQFKQRLLDYLYTENREGAIVQSVCRFLDNKAWRFARPLVVKLELARNVPRLDEIVSEKQRLNAELDTQRRQREETIRALDVMVKGGRLSRDYPGYDALVDAQISKSGVEGQVLKPVRAWIGDGAKFSDAKRNGYRPLIAEIEQRIDAFIMGAEDAANNEIDQVEKLVIEKIAPIAELPERPKTTHVRVDRPQVEAISVGMAGSYFGFFLLGIVLVAAIGGGAGWALLNSPTGPDLFNGWIAQLQANDIQIDPVPPATPETGAILGAAAGAIVGAILGLFFRAITAGGARRKRVQRLVEERIEQMVFGAKAGNGQAKNSVRELLKEEASRRRTQFRNTVERAFEKSAGKFTERLNALQDEEQTLRAEQEATINRLEPKVEQLQGLGRDAHDIAEKGAPVNRPKLIESSVEMEDEVPEAAPVA